MTKVIKRATVHGIMFFVNRLKSIFSFRHTDAMEFIFGVIGLSMGYQLAFTAGWFTWHPPHDAQGAAGANMALAYAQYAATLINPNPAAAYVIVYSLAQVVGVMWLKTTIRRMGAFMGAWWCFFYGYLLMAHSPGHAFGGVIFCVGFVEAIVYNKLGALVVEEAKMVAIGKRTLTELGV